MMVEHFRKLKLNGNEFTSEFAENVLHAATLAVSVGHPPSSLETELTTILGAPAPAAKPAK